MQQSSPQDKNTGKKFFNNLKDFLLLDLQQVDICVPGIEQVRLLGKTLYKIELKYGKYGTFTCLRRFNDFYALNKVVVFIDRFNLQFWQLKIRFGLIDWPKFPSKQEIFNKIEKRKTGFTQLLQKMVESARQHKTLTDNVLNLLFHFLTKDLTGKVPEKSTEKQDGSSSRQESLDNDGEDDEITNQIMSALDRHDSFVCNHIIMEIYFQADSSEFSTYSSPLLLAQSAPILINEQKTPVAHQEKTITEKWSEKITEKTDSVIQGIKQQIEGVSQSKKFTASSPPREDPKKLLQKSTQQQQLQPFAYKKEMENYGEYILIRFSESDEYKTFFAKIDKSNLLLFSQINVHQDSFQLQICLYQAQIDKFPDHIELYHELDCKKIQISLDGEVPSRNKNENNYYKTYDHKIKVLIEQLKFAIQKPPTNIPEYINEDFNPIVKEAINLQNLPQNSLLQVRIKFKPFICKTKVHMKSENPQWRQDFIIPINDSYGVISLEVVLLINDGVFSKHQREQILGCADILIADILSQHSDTKIQSLKLPLDTSQADSKNNILSLINKIQQRQQKNMTIQDPEQQSYLVVSIRNLSSIYSLFAAVPINRYEGEKQDPDFNDLKINIIRVKRIISLIQILSVQIEDLIDQKYPKLTAMFLSFIWFFVLLADMGNILSYMIFGIICLVVYQNPYVKPVVDRLYNQRLLDLNPTYMLPLIFDDEEFELIKNTQPLEQVIKFQGNEIQIEDDGDDNNENIFNKANNLWKKLFVLQVYLQYFTCGVEKVINLMTWSEPRRTLYILFVIVIGFMVISILPIRLLILIGIISEWFDGKKVYAKRQAHNYMIGKNLIEYVFKKYSPDSIKDLQYQEKEWPNHQGFRSKVLEVVRMHLGLHVGDETLNNYKTPVEFIKAIMTCSKKLKLARIIDLSFDRDELYYQLRNSCKFRMKPHHLILYTINNYCYNIPSDYYRLRYPRKQQFGEF